MRHCYTKTAQLELFEPQGDREPPVVPRWQSLPDQARDRTTYLLAQLLLEHENQHPDVAVRKPDALRILIDQMAARSAQEINTSALAKLTKLQRITVDQYLDVLIRLSMLTKLGAWTSGAGKREIKNPKFHFVDTGIACALRRLTDTSFDIGNAPEALGGVLESFVVNELLRALPLQNADYRLYHWHSPDQREVDIVIDSGARLVCVEVKASASVSTDDFKHLKWFAKDGPGRGRGCTGIVFSMGREKLSFGGGQYALPVNALWAGIKDAKTGDSQSKLG